MSWQTTLADALSGGIDVVAWVPDKRLSPVAEQLEGRVPVRILTSEEDCVGYAAGVRAAGGMPAVLFQSSGLGNCLNALASLALPYGLGFPIALSMRGTLGEENPAQTLLGKRAAPLLHALGVQTFSVDAEGRIPVLVHGALSLAHGVRDVAALLLEPELDRA